MKFPDAEQRLWDEMMAFIESLRDTYGDDFKLGDIVLVADVLTDFNPIAIHGSDPRCWVQQALLGEAYNLAEEKSESRAPALDDLDAD